jgi:hypothetical protein
MSSEACQVLLAQGICLRYAGIAAQTCAFSVMIVLTEFTPHQGGYFSIALACLWPDFLRRILSDKACRSPATANLRAGRPFGPQRTPRRNGSTANPGGWRHRRPPLPRWTVFNGFADQSRDRASFKTLRSSSSDVSKLSHLEAPRGVKPVIL